MPGRERTIDPKERMESGATACGPAFDSAWNAVDDANGLR